ncbi:MAG: FecR domain-containing protein, partial [Oscillospiraceae bacterium]|nr:FecR domain-containing protein [Oscillospiraceae bacterium]
MKKRISLILALSLLLTLSVPAAAANDAVGTTLRLTETKGTVTVKTAAGKSKSVVKSMRLYNGYTVGTGASSSAYIGLDDTKAVQLDASGLVEIKKQGKKLEVSLTSGQLYFNVTEPLKTNESLNIRTATMVTGIRGSFGWVTPEEMGLMHGHVTLTCTNPETGASRVTEVYSGEKVSFEAAAQETAADPALLEIDFVKEEITNADVPAIVVEAVKNDETLQRQLTEDVESIDVPTLIDSLEIKQAEEKAAEEAAQAQVEEAVAAQETA